MDTYNIKKSTTHLTVGLLFFLSALSLSGCVSSQDKRYKEYFEAKEKLDKLIESECFNPESTIASFLGIPFNINKDQHQSIIDTLMQEGKLLMSDSDQLYYSFEFEIPFKITSHAYYIPKFYQEKLYEVNLVLEPESTFGSIPDWLSKSELSESIHRQVKSLYFDRFGGSGNEHFIYIPSIIEGFDGDPIWVYGTTIIKVMHNLHNQTIIRYNHIPILNEIKDKENADKMAEKENTLGDL